MYKKEWDIASEIAKICLDYGVSIEEAYQKIEKHYKNKRAKDYVSD